MRLLLRSSLWVCTATGAGQRCPPVVVSHRCLWDPSTIKEDGESSKYSTEQFDKGRKKTPIPAQPAGFKFKRFLDYKDDGADQPVMKPSEPKGWGLQNTRFQPVNPQWVKACLPRKQLTRRQLTVGEAMLENNRGNKLSVEQCESLLDNYASTKWYNFAWRFIRSFDMQSLKSYSTSMHVMMIGSVVISQVCLLGMYLAERNAFRSLDEDEQRDYKTVVYGMRASKVKEIGKKALEEHDPLMTLPLKQRMSIVVKRFRDLGLTEKDWELEKRKEKSDFIEDLDWFHMVYWMMIYSGNLITGGTNMFEIDQMENVANASLAKDLQKAARS